MPGRHHPIARRAAVVVAALAMTLAGSCGTAASPGRASVGPSGTPTPGTATSAAGALPPAVQTLEIVGTEYAFTVTPTGTLRPGWTRVEFDNRGHEAHQVMFARIKDGVDMGALAAAAGGDSSGSRAIEYVDMLGGVSYIGAGRRVEAMVDLPAGMVMAMCYVPDAIGKAHALSGMTTMLTVADEAAAGSVPRTGTEPVRGTIVMDRGGYHLPDTLPAGWYRVVNRDEGTAGRGLHELSILGLDREVTDDGLRHLLDDLATNATPDVPLVALGGMGALSAGFEGYLYLDLGSGSYLAVDFMPDPGNPRPHLLDGYVTRFRV